MDELPVFEPFTGIHTVKAVTDALDIGWLGMGAFTKEFEEKIGQFVAAGARPVLATNTGTSALHLALLVAGVGPGDEVIVPSFNFVADHQVISATGAEPVFCDIRRDNLGLDVEKAQALVSPRTKAILPLHYAGIPCDLDGVYRLAERHSLRVIEDATHAFGSTHRGQKIGSFGDITCFSFDAVKVVTAIDGGAVVCRNDDELTKLQHYRLLGIDRDTVERYKNKRAWEYDVVDAGFRYHMTNINASIGLSQLARVEGFIESRRATCRYFNEQLAGLDGIETPHTDFSDVSPFIYFVLVRPSWRLELIDFLRERGVATGIHFMAAHNYTFYKECRHGDMEVTNQVVQQQLTLPLHSHMPIEKAERVVSGIKAFVAHKARAHVAA
ncbi:MAG TPA: DegT/DnrJ/EryC1/StrS family aminotransferase [Chloroflexota bacterium]|nr:DegT/DnrJ/EryC1/StrS family aminotransferase [Chloroflexota bacterium]